MISPSLSRRKARISTPCAGWVSILVIVHIMLKPTTPSFTRYFRQIAEVDRMNALFATLIKTFAETAVSIAVDSTKQAAEQVFVPAIMNEIGGKTDEDIAKIIDGMRSFVTTAIALRDSPAVVHAAERLGAAIPMNLIGSKHAHVYNNETEVNEYMKKFYPDSAFMGE